MLTNVIDVTENCRHSLMCRHVCPVGNLTRLESLTPHGWAQLIAMERRGLASWNPETVDVLYSCADCGSCRSHCVTSQALPEAIAAARALVVERDLAPAIVYELETRLRDWGNPFDSETPEPEITPGKDALFVGDEAHFLDPSGLKAALSLLDAVGVEPVLIGRGRNTGYLASSLGLPNVASDLARANLDELEAAGADRLFVLSPGDYFSFSQMYDERLGLTLPSGVELLDVVGFLAAQMEKGTLRTKTSDDATRYAYVDPTHAVRVNRSESARKLLRGVLPQPPLELFWRDGRAYPCGDLALEFTQPDLSDRLTRARLEDAVQAGAEGVITEAAGSLHHLKRHAPAPNLRVRGLYEVLAENVTTSPDA